MFVKTDSNKFITSMNSHHHNHHHHNHPNHENSSTTATNEGTTSTSGPSASAVAANAATATFMSSLFPNLNLAAAAAAAQFVNQHQQVNAPQLAGQSTLSALQQYQHQLPAGNKYSSQQQQGTNNQTSNTNNNSNNHNNNLAEVHDLIHLPGPLTEDALLRTLYQRFYNKSYFVSFEKSFKFCP